MIKPLLLIAFCSAFLFSAPAQNLVPNSSFEEYTDCPTWYSCITYGGLSFPYVSNWFAPSAGSSDYFNACAPVENNVSIPESPTFGHNPSHICNAMAGFFAYYGGNYREYIEVQLTEPLTSGTNYYIEFYATTAFYPDDPGSYNFIAATDEIGAYISEDPVLEGISTTLSFTPQIENEEGVYMEDSSLWYKVSGVYAALGGEEYITIGNFKTDDETDFVIMNDADPSGGSSSYVFVDDVIVTEYTGDVPTDPGDVILCEGETVNIMAPYSALSYDWSTGEHTQTITVTEPGTYSVTVDFDCETITYVFNVYSFPTEAITSYTADYICLDDLPLILNGAPGFTDYSWNTGDFTDSITIDEPGLYVVTASNVCTIEKDSFDITALDPSTVDLNLGNDTLICTNEPWSVILDATDDFDTYTWSTGETSQTITVTEDGSYSVEAVNICGTWTDIITIESGAVLFKPDLGPDIVLCEDEGFTEVTFTAQEQDCYYNWNTAETTEAITVHEPGLFWVSCNNVCGRTGDSVVVQLCTYLYMPSAFSPNDDGVNDIYAPVAYEGVDLISFVIYNRWGELLFETNDITKGWDGTNADGELMPVAAYTYMVQFDQFGYTQNKKGSLTLVR